MDLILKIETFEIWNSKSERELEIKINCMYRIWMWTRKNTDSDTTFTTPLKEIGV